MTRLSHPREIDKRTLKVTRELLEVHAERRAAVKLHDGYLTKLFYDHGLSVEEIATAYGVSSRAVYAIIARQPVDCHDAGQDCTACGAVA